MLFLFFEDASEEIEKKTLWGPGRGIVFSVNKNERVGCPATGQSEQ
jgi:hypothetical protein